ncbi:hypothetical protein KR51_00015110 [Rubidibacter lacunae KORDI 51-2]|uniref:DUF2007 domain-containing protein n=1 Tax=Rubidibacter lacunae KORDI 51-2 TaxID=582515 RepID=U5DLS8_9CHRO|nr:hypothetical protein [Rubidibacter lacunae]ERN41847.1 hypothetical protein KR51_00015110 [Rubidibacter lacunae KORDI 51-2]
MIESTSWIVLRTTPARWEAELMQQMLAAHDVPARIIDMGASVYLGQGSPAALQVRSEDRWTAMLLLSSPENPLESDEPDNTG